jgi:predicted HNH restriction endonuclease
MSVHVHHRRKIAWFVNTREKTIDWENANDLDNLVTLCAACHKVADGHRRVRGFKPL